ncbi:TIGR03086 family metal-binding protein [Actinokineospora spheciospongiae]|uniref:TIGR03086 family metal-binding protein n=1 Tax=Actinokineospora spheciospongiae TaxID=909613 RepID=UPI000D716295|nr:TIGR03086 family metal-binding protein [Actinokineospora spheciospongiae]PWW65565.1 uncharacterized protein (TIGR03086 family) [Actinokineospora spheciospongiae]
MDIRELDRAAIASTTGFAEQATDEQLDARTPCDKWAVRDVLEHMVDNNRRTLGQLGAGFEPTGDPRADFRASSAALHAHFADDAVLARTFAIGDYQVPGEFALAVHFGDVLVHGWDIGTALGLDVELDESLVLVALDRIGRFPDSPRIWGPGGLFANRLPVADDAPPQERLLALTGRSGDWR